ncbi:Fic family protein [Pseudomonas aeruginosa]|uniref:Fic family protein n=1 Tax=Pseudomonas aeruginosa TaxID=287 RepID=UPI0025C9F117|nr:Fic family protein [Pseudomonas aeruginosa]EKW9641057.1 Fic family protein [Pseudomonas aeruginosa]
MSAVGYNLLIEQLGLSATPLTSPAIVRPVTRIEKIGHVLAVPQNLAPAAADLLGHTLFALKHEGVNLAVLAQVLPGIPAAQLEQASQESPNGIYLRKVCYLWEAFTGQELRQHAPVKAGYAPLFEPDRYITMSGERSPKWRIEFNGLGDLTYCATVERTDDLTQLLAHDILSRAKAFIESLPPTVMDRAINWAYLHETKDSFAIEREAPSEDKSRKFIQLLRQAHEKRDLTEDYLVELQNAVVGNPYDKAAAFRHQQNYLTDGTQGAAGVTYLPPPPDLCRELMESLMRFANEAPTQIDPLVAASVISFGFVFNHPFMDGNGRLSRFLVHQALCRAGALENGLLLPVSVAMKRQERQYLDTLQSFSRPARTFWDVRWIDAGEFDFTFKGADPVYRYWDATQCAVFTLRMAQLALEEELQKETEFLECYDAVYRAVDERFDVRGSDLALLVMMCLTNEGKVSINRRKQFQYTVPEAVFGYIEDVAQSVMAQQRSMADIASAEEDD